MTTSLSITPELSSLLNHHGVMLTQLTEDVSKEMRLCNKMMVFDTYVTVGYFHDPILREAILFHEMAHVELGMARACSYEEERDVWKTALANMRRFNFLPPYSILKECVKQLYEYRNV